MNASKPATHFGKIVVHRAKYISVYYVKFILYIPAHKKRYIQTSLYILVLTS